MLPVFLLVFALYGVYRVSQSKPAPRERSPEELRRIAGLLRFAGWTALFTAGAYLSAVRAPGTPWAYAVLVVTAIVQLLAVYRLAKALDAPLLAARCFLCLVPTICLINTVVIIFDAKTVLQRRM